MNYYLRKRFENMDNDPVPTVLAISIILAATGFGGYAISKTIKEDQEYQQTKIECAEAEDKMFDEGEHIIAVDIEDPTSSMKEYRVQDGYKPLGISTSGYGQNGYHFGKAFILYENTTPVMAHPTDKNLDGEYIYEEFGYPLEKEDKTIIEEDGKTIYSPGTHMISVPFNGYTMDYQFDSYEGYEVVGMANSTYGKNGPHGYHGCILYVNNEEVVVDKTNSEDQVSFGTPTGKVLTK